MSNIQPLYKGGPSFPLSDNPHYSRTESQNLDFGEGDPPKNYQFVAFRPGFSLQASELNEMQENIQMQMSLTIAMMHNWMISGTGHGQKQWDMNSPGGEGGQWDTNDVSVPNTGLGVGGTLDGHNRNYAISGPGWRGATPLYPFYSSYQGETLKSVSVVKNGGDYEFTFNTGWWLVENKGHWDGGETQPHYISGLKHWVYLDTPIEHVVQSHQVSNADYVVVGFNLKKEVIESNRQTIISCGSNFGQDSSLADNANGIPNSASCGADRYAVSIEKEVGVDVSINNGGWSSVENDANFITREEMNPVCVIRKEDNSVRYMNNLMIADFS